MESNNRRQWELMSLMLFVGMDIGLLFPKFSVSYSGPQALDSPSVVSLPIPTPELLISREEGVKDSVSSPWSAADPVASLSGEDLYFAGIDAYIQRDLRTAQKAFTMILRDAPGNIEAQNALRRVNAEIYFTE